MAGFPHDLEAPRPGLVVLQMDETIENDFRHLFAPGTARLQVSRVPSGAKLTPAAMDSALSVATGSTRSAMAAPRARR
ncbi:hypothetical protein [Poseidonocella sp. HB161398]|uniref:hypothetical protein n=1 Tax=Poseidonocella sp. HB161398 TaxID=2320855 RepID=UPI00351603CA